MVSACVTYRIYTKAKLAWGSRNCQPLNLVEGESFLVVWETDHWSFTNWQNYCCGKCGCLIKIKTYWGLRWKHSDAFKQIPIAGKYTDHPSGTLTDSLQSSVRQRQSLIVPLSFRGINMAFLMILLMIFLTENFHWVKIFQCQTLVIYFARH